MTQLKKIVEKPIKKKELERLLWLHRGINTIDEKGRKVALQKNKHFMEKEGKYISPEEFHALLFSKHIKDEHIPAMYQKELHRYHNMFVNSVSEMLEMPEIKDAKLGKTLGIPQAKENIFEIKKKGRRVGFVHLNKKDKTIDFIKKLDDIPNKFKKKLKK